MADIEKMYRQVIVHRDNQKYQKILWRPRDGEPIKVYRLKITMELLQELK